MRLEDRRLRLAGAALLAAVAAFWLVIVIRQIAEAGFYSDDWAIQWEWNHYGFEKAVDRQFDILGSKPLLGILLIGSYEVLGTNPAWHHLLAAVLGLSTAGTFYLVLRQLRFEPRDALPIALLALLFPWASAIRLWPTGMLNNFAILLLFGGFLIAMLGLRVGGGRGLLIHVVATGCYVASVLTYEVTVGVALFLWTAYVWLFGWRAARPRIALDLSAVGLAALYTKENTNKHVESLADQIGHLPDIVGDGAKLIAASLAPLSVPAKFSAVLTALILAAAAAILIAAARRPRHADGSGAAPGRRWAVVAVVSLAALGLCWAIFVPQAFYTPTFRGLEDRVNVLALYPAAVLVWAVLRAAGTLLGRNGYLVAVAGAVVVAIGYGINDIRQQNDWLRSTDLQEEVLGRDRPSECTQLGGRPGVRLSSRGRAPRPGLERDIRPLPRGATADRKGDRDLPGVHRCPAALLDEGGGSGEAGDAALRQDQPQELGHREAPGLRRRGLRRRREAPPPRRPLTGGVRGRSREVRAGAVAALSAAGLNRPSAASTGHLSTYPLQHWWNGYPQVGCDDGSSSRSPLALIR